MRLFKFLIIFSTLIFASIMLLSCLPEDVPGRDVTVSQRYYKINSDTILGEIKTSSNNQMFQLVDDNTGEYESVYQGKQYSWSSNDFNQVVEIVVDQILNDDLDHWQIAQVWYGVSCRNSEAVIHSGGMDIYQEQTKDGKVQYRDLRMINVHPASNDVFLAKREYTTEKQNQYLSSWGSQDLSQINVSAEQALAFSRESLENQISFEESCEARIRLVTRNGNLYWKVTHPIPLSGVPDVYVYVNASTGEIEAAE